MPFNGKTKHDVVTEFRNAEILAAAHKIFAENGFAGASVEAIAQEAGIAKGTLYLYYSSKHEIYSAALKTGFLALNRELKEKAASACTAEDGIRAFIATKLSFFEQHRDFFKIYYAEFGNATTQKEFQHLILDQIQILKDILSEAWKQKKIRDVSVEPTAFAIFDLTRGAIAQRLLGYSQTCVQEEISFLYDFIWKGIACQ
jgi:TetR/AcrR family transcriptional regulator